MNYSKSQLYFLVILRMTIGWHFLYEAFLKLLNPGWSSQGYLSSAEGPLAFLFQWLGSESMVGITDILTIVILLVAGLSLILGFREKAGAWAGMIMLAMFYLAHPPFPWLSGAGPAEGNYLFINKNLIELFALGVVAFFPTSQFIGLKHLFTKNTAS